MDVNQIFFIGHNKYGQAGIGQQQHNKKFTKLKSIVFKTFIKQVSCGSNHSGLLTIDGLIYTMGSNIHGTLGLGSSVSINYAFRPTLIKQLKDVDQIFSGSYHMCAIKQGELYSWGKGIDGQLGHGNMKNLFIPTLIQTLGNDVQTVSCGLNHTLILMNSNRSNHSNSSSPTKLNNGYAFGNGIYGQLGNGSNRSFNYPVNINFENIQSISAGENHSLFISNGLLYGCGDNTYCQLGKLDQLGKLGKQNNTKKQIISPQRIQTCIQEEITYVDSFNLCICLTSSNRSYVWGGKQKIWPPVEVEGDQLNQTEILNVKVGSQKLYYANSKNQIVLVALSNAQSNNQSNESHLKQSKQIICSDKSIIDFDAGQNHFIAIGDIIAQVQEKDEAEILSIWEGQSLHQSKQTFSQKRFDSQNNKYFVIDELSEPSSKLQNFFLTKHLRSGKSSEQQSFNHQISQKLQSQSSSHQRNCFDHEYLQQNKMDNNLSSSIEIQPKSALLINNSDTKRYIQDKNKPNIDSCEQKSARQKIAFQNLISNVQVKYCPSRKLQKLMHDMDQKTVHLKKSNNQIDLKDEIFINNQRNQKNQQKTIMKTPSSYIKKEPQRFILQSEQNVLCNSFLADPKIQTFELGLIKNQPLKQVSIQNINNIQQGQNKNMKQRQYFNPQQKQNSNLQQKQNIIYQQKSIKLRDRAKSILNYNESGKQNNFEEEQQKSGCFKEISCNNTNKQDKTIETIFRQLLRKHHKQKILNQKHSQLNLSRQAKKSKNKNNRLSHSCISQKIQQTSNSKNNKQSIQTQQKSKTSEIKISPLNESKLGISKASLHSNISGKNSFRRNPDLLEISRSNRQLRYELRNRDLKISKLQQDLSKKQMEIQILYRKLEYFKSQNSCCQQCSLGNKMQKQEFC